ncbi:TonB-dependent receptor domain-containing protein [Winogradskyella thalassocola]|uniref:Outer membrane receptor proteins, mostly Fe transport n=1 Tax=Winogradskyella thalassocola TaxID=262004 RepID=A0A1G7WZ65_9FLAO|nr:outer membrane beta-barrel family protein [Winogradskyella thalassocola]SDG77205.1 Outer membrane receptor proteins, mostly Fe transport [Winogradskyella thalassocola]
MIIRLRLFFCVCICMLSHVLVAQDYSVSGRVVDADSNPIEFANVIILTEIDGDYLKGTSTDDNGFFSLINLSETTFYLKISYLGFEEFEQKIVLTGDLDLKNIQLSDIPENLNEVTVIAKKPTITRKPDRLIFNVENTALVEGSTLSVLKHTPGIIVSEGTINIKSTPAIVYINNRRVQLTSEELITLLESAPANSIKSVEVITNPPASYDADSGAVINIIMSKNLVTGYRGSVFTNYTQGVFPRYNGGTSHYFKNNKVNLNLNYSYTKNKINRDQEDTFNFLDDSNEVEEIWKSNINRNTWSENHHLNLNFDYYINDKNTLSLTSTGLYTPYYKYQIQNNTNITDENLVFQQRFTADNLSRDNKYNIGTDLIFRRDFKNDANLMFNAHYTIYDYSRDQNVLTNNFDANNLFSGDSEFNSISSQKTNIITGKIDYSLPLNETSSFGAGVKYSNVNTDSDITKLDIVGNSEVIDVNNTDAFRYDEKVFAAYSNYAKSWDKWELNIGLRVEQSNIEGESLSLTETNTQDYFGWFPNASLSNQLLEDVRIYGNYKRSLSRPSYTDLNPFTFFLNENNVVLGNPNLVPTYYDHFKIGTDFLEHFTFEVYYVNYDGDIVELPRQNNTTNIVAYTPTNLDKKVEYGFDFQFIYSPTNIWDLYFVTSFYNISEEADFGEGFVKQDQWSNYSILSNSFSFLKDQSLSASLTFTWIGKNLQQFQTVEDRLVSELSLSKTVFKKKGVISLAVEDFFNLQNYETSTRYLNQSSSGFGDIDSRYIKLGFRYNFGNTKLNTNERTTSAEERERLKDLN